MADPLKYRKKTEEEEWRNKGPILIMKQHMNKLGFLTPPVLEGLESEIEGIVEDSVKFAEQSPYLPNTAITEEIYARNKP